MKQGVSRRRFIRAAVAAGAAGALAGGHRAVGESTGAISGFDHVALPMQNTEQMLAFYRRLGLQVNDSARTCSVYIGNQMIHFHHPELWQNPSFKLRAPAAKPPCGDLCFVWDGTPESLKAMLDGAGAKVIDGPSPKQGGRQKPSSSVYIRDPDGNLLEFMIYS